MYLLPPQRCVLKSVPTDAVSLLIPASVSRAGEDWTAPAVSPHRSHHSKAHFNVNRSGKSWGLTFPPIRKSGMHSKYLLQWIFKWTEAKLTSKWHVPSKFKARLLFSLIFKVSKERKKEVGHRAKHDCAPLVCDCTIHTDDRTSVQLQRLHAPPPGLYSEARQIIYAQTTTWHHLWDFIFKLFKISDGIWILVYINMSIWELNSSVSLFFYQFLNIYKKSI